jgi:hypothetical protein
MSGDHSTPAASDAVIEVNLRKPEVAAFWAWFFPGAGHLYQRRYAKAMLFMVCILGTYFYGLALGNGHVVYASFTENDRRWQYICQLGVGLPALPALVQSHLVLRMGKEPFFDYFMAPPHPVTPNAHDMLAEWHEESKYKFELGTLYTMIAGLMNVLVIYDAFAGPMAPPAEDEKKKKRGPPPDTSGGAGDSPPPDKS